VSDVPGDDVPEYDEDDPSGDRAVWLADEEHKEFGHDREDELDETD
jgi:hypothetical protein